MASVCNDGGGKKRITWVHPLDKSKRPSIRLGKKSKSHAETVRIHVENLVAAQAMGSSPIQTTATWVGGIPDDLHSKLAKHGLVEPRERGVLSKLGPFLRDYIASRTDVRSQTMIKYNSTAKLLIERFGDDKPLAAITLADADAWRNHLLGQGLAENTVRKRAAIAKVFFNAAIKRELLARNPMRELKSTVMANAKRFHFVTREEIAAVLDACPDAEWRAIVALARYGGLRCPSELVPLEWEHVNWERGRLTVQSPKTAHHAGGESRVIPLFPELRAVLDELWEQPSRGTVHVITRYRNAGQNLRTQFERIIKRAGVKPWPKLFQNLRSTRETELIETYPAHVVTAWLGHTESVAAKHYLQVTGEHFQRAAEEVAQKAAQKAHASPRSDSQSNDSQSKRPVVLQGLASGENIVNTGTVLPLGLEPRT